MTQVGLVWIRRDLRLHDHAALSTCLAECDTTYIAFVFDPTILDPIKRKASSDRRVHFICESLLEIAQTLHHHNAGLIVEHGDPVDVIPALLTRHRIDRLYFNRDYAPYPITRDATVSQAASGLGVEVCTFRDHVICEPDRVLNKHGSPYKVFTPYSKAWHQHVSDAPQLLTPFPVQVTRIQNPIQSTYQDLSSLLAIAGFDPAPPFLTGGSSEGRRQLTRFMDSLPDYHHARDLFGVDGTSKLSVYIRHGCLSIRDLIHAAFDSASAGADTWLTELIWREFYQMVLWHFPHVIDRPFNPKYESLSYPSDERYLAAWKAGATGFPIIDAAMRCLNQTGWMHNRLRMVTASFLCKTLLVDWKRGERYFSWKLLDYELASNNGGWQWASGTGCDAAPYFRIFNPTTQSLKFDPSGAFIRDYCPELRDLDDRAIHAPYSSSTTPGIDYPRPIVDYPSQREACLAMYRSI